jgi:hypothetical protein
MQILHSSHEQSALLQRNNSDYKKIIETGRTSPARRKIKMSIFGSAMKNVIAARERQAQRYVARILADMDDSTLKSVGKTRESLKSGKF